MPEPARFALHKILVSRLRTNLLVKSQKDIQHACVMLGEHRSGDIRTRLLDLPRSARPMVRRALLGVRSMLETHEGALFGFEESIGAGHAVPHFRAGISDDQPRVPYSMPSPHIAGVDAVVPVVRASHRHAALRCGVRCEQSGCRMGADAVAKRCKSCNRDDKTSRRGRSQSDTRKRPLVGRVLAAPTFDRQIAEPWSSCLIATHGRCAEERCA
ncbi:nucleotidyltransferase domain-containing protein [Paraburkholderia sp. CNPSo 3272]|uniref:nucleotidyltransferase domain-containing protein n=1 Tax=Paraburkholderia sp. CNPSo 3272 TaxID=2940931 RepID=UPI0020B8F135|nr:nucleotidyltransferase domain-containing protein [Paraburkholderia sp. CNPSo 3272]MCP3728423.1 nucleotidyltransferase domain-containing protein [Paraburkholderia sp. CNPSo 3272]